MQWTPENWPKNNGRIGEKCLVCVDGDLVVSGTVEEVAVDGRYLLAARLEDGRRVVAPPYGPRDWAPSRTATGLPDWASQPGDQVVRGIPVPNGETPAYEILVLPNDPPQLPRSVAKLAAAVSLVLVRSGGNSPDTICHLVNPETLRPLYLRQKSIESATVRFADGWVTLVGKSEIEESSVELAGVSLDDEELDGDVIQAAIDAITDGEAAGDEEEE